MLRKYSAIDLRGIRNDHYDHVVGLVGDDCDFTAVMIMPDHLRGIKDIISNKRPDVVFAQGKDLSTNRKIIESSEVDILSRPYPIDDTLAKMAQRNDKCFEICARDIIRLKGYIKARAMQSLAKTIELAVKRDVRIVITSGARDRLEVLTPRELVAFGVVLGFEYTRAKGAISNVPRAFLSERGLL